MGSNDRLARIALAFSIIGGVSYVASWSLPLSDAASLAWKGTGVGFLALYAALLARSLDGWLICAVMVFGALGDVLLGAAGLTVGAVAFLIGHLLAIWLYARNRRQSLSFSQKLFAILLVPAVVATSYLLPGDRTMAAPIALYAAGLAIMAAMAWTSRFPRFLVGAGAVMFVVSDLLIFARSGPIPESFWSGLAVWALYYAGQLMICIGVVNLVRTRA